MVQQTVVNLESQFVTAKTARDFEKLVGQFTAKIG